MASRLSAYDDSTPVVSVRSQVPGDSAVGLPAAVAGAEVAFVLWSGHLGGAQALTAEMAGALRSRGVDASIVFVCDGERLTRRLVELDVPYHALGLRRGRDVIRHPRAIARLVNEAGADCAILVSTGYLASSLRLGGYRRPIAAVEHGSLLQIDQLSFGRRLLRRVDRALSLWACDVEVAVSSYMFEVLRAGRHARRLVCIRNGIDLVRFSPARGEACGDRPFTIGYAGRLVATKGVSDVIRAFASMSSTSDSRLLIAGDGPERRALECLARALNVAERIRFLGRIDDMPTFWHACDIGVVPSGGLVESFSLSAVESMACGLPVVASRTGALPETVREELTGLLVDEGDTQELARMFDRYANDASLRRDHGNRARQLCEERYDLLGTVRGYLELIASLSVRPHDAAGEETLTLDRSDL